jgi:uncharacterized protein
MHILLTGASGLIGRAVTAWLTNRGHSVVPLRRGSVTNPANPSWNPQTGEIRLVSAVPFEAVIHLAGETIVQRWTPAAKERIRASRVEATRLLCGALAQLPQPPQVLVCASATGFYGERGDAILDEQSAPGAGFLPTVCQAWEAAAAPAIERNIRVVHLRLGLVLTRHGGALAKMLPAFRLGLGGRIGSGRQYWSWIEIEDLLRLIEWALTRQALCGGVNAVSPDAVTNADFTRTLALALGRPAFLPVPAAAVNLVFGEMGRDVLLASARVRPARLLADGFEFRFPQLESALNHALLST